VAEYDWRLAVEGSGEPLVLVPGMDGTGQLFYRQVPLLARSYRVATYALRNEASTMATLVDISSASSPSSLRRRVGQSLLGSRSAAPWP